ncbi:MAG TPA: SprT family zinc-dependent metalloprotease [Candidatus Paceibacterota bacterium]|nr:SprT family zinc-dependent metalloprotease [Candidatus Paceibacterota bacterium]
MTSQISYALRRSLRTRSIRISIRGRDEVVVSAPRSMSEQAIDRFVRSKSDWITNKLEYLKKLPDHMFLKSSSKDFETYKDAALGYAERRIAHFNKTYKFDFKKIVIRNQKTRWGSCSKSGTLSFNYKIVLLPAYLADYIIVHELCHRAEMNHSKSFWSLVARTMPDYKKLRAELNGKGMRQ